MKITNIKIIGFRRFEEEFSTDLYDITSITGANTKGKTTLVYAIVWAFLGTNLTGDDKIWLGNRRTEDCYVEVKFIDNQGEEHLLVRYKNKYNNMKNYIMLDDKKVEQKDLKNFYYDNKLFLTIVSPNYFLGKDSADQKALLDKYLPQIDIKTVYERLEDNEKKILEGIPKNILDYIKELNSNKKFYDTNIKNLNGKIEYAEKIANEELEERWKFEKKEELSNAKNELLFLIEQLKNINLDKMRKTVEELDRQITKLGREFEDVTLKIETEDKEYLSIKSQEIAHCPMCKQEIKDTARLNAILKMKEELESLFAKRDEIENELSKLKPKLMTEKCKLLALNKKEGKDIDEKITKVKEQIKGLEYEETEIEKHNNYISIKENNIEGAKQDIKEFKAKIKEYEKLIDNVKETKKVANKLLINYIEAKMSFATKYLKNVKIKYDSVLKETGEIKEAFIITYNGSNLKEISQAESIATSIELRNMFNKISGANIPIFIDNNENCTDFDFIQELTGTDTQIVIAEARKGQKLTIKEGKLSEKVYEQAA